MTARMLALPISIGVGLIGLVYGFVYEDPVGLAIGAIGFAGVAVLTWINARDRDRR